MGEQTLELTPTWIVAGMCSFVVLPSLVAERCLHYLAKAVKRRHPKPLYRVFLKIKQELLQGFVALLLTVFQNLIQKTCISPSLADHMLPCQRASEMGPTKRHYVASQIIGIFGSRMLNEDAEGSAHCRLKNDFKKVVGISWYMWIFVMFYLLLNINGWHTYFWISFLPLLLLLAIGTKLQHIIDKLAQDIAESHSVTDGDLVVKPSDDLFWFRQPRIILYLIHFILFQNAFEIAFFIWILITYGFNSCIMGKAGFTVPRLVIGVIIQFVCSYSTLPLYAIVTQMGSGFNKEFFSNNVQQGLRGWARGAKMRRRYSLFHARAGSITTNTSGDPSGLSIEMTRRTSREGNFSDENIE